MLIFYAVGLQIRLSGVLGISAKVGNGRK